MFCPCTVGWKTPPEQSIALCREAVRTNYFPLWECEDSRFTITQQVKDPRPVSELISMIGKFKHLREPEIAVLQEQVDRRFRTLQALCEGTAGS